MKNYKLIFPLLGSALLAGSAHGSYTFVDLTPHIAQGAFGFGAGIAVHNGTIFQCGDVVLADGLPHAALWKGSAASYIDLDGGRFSSSYANATDGISQGGVVVPMGSSQQQAAMWSGNLSSYINLNPANCSTSEVNGVFGGHQIGDGNVMQQVANGVPSGGSTRALLWSGSAATAIDLTPAGFVTGIGEGISALQQVGYAYGGATVNPHAFLWTGSATSAVDLTPPGTDYAEAFGTDGTTQVGEALNNGDGFFHAFLWHGTAASSTDLHIPAYSGGSYAVSSLGNLQVGAGITASGNQHGLVWAGSANDYYDLQNSTPTMFTESVAHAVDSNGNVVGFVDYNTVDSLGNPVTVIHAALWLSPTFYFEGIEDREIGKGDSDDRDDRGTSCFSNKSTIHLSFELPDYKRSCDKDPKATISLFRLDGQAQYAVANVLYRTRKNTGAIFAQKDDNYSYDISLANLPVGKYRVQASLADGGWHSGYFQVYSNSNDRH